VDSGASRRYSARRLATARRDLVSDLEDLIVMAPSSGGRQLSPRGKSCAAEDADYRRTFPRTDVLAWACSG
jgi:hypothetical protein